MQERRTNMTKKEFQDLLAVVDKLAHLALDKPSLPSNLDEAAIEWCKTNNKGVALCGDKKSHYLADGVNAFKAGAEWMAKQGVSYQDTISSHKTIPILPMKDVSDMEFDYGDKVIVQIREKQ